MAESHREEIAKLEALYAGNPGGRVFVHLAEAYRKAGEHERARRILDEGLARHSDSASGYVVLGRVLADMQITEEAETAFRRVLELDGGNLVALRWLGDLARQSGRSAEAALHYRELLIRNPSNEEVRDLVEIVEREAAEGLPAAAGADARDETADAFAGLSLDTAEHDEAGVSAPVSEAEEPAVTSPSVRADAPQPDITPISAAPGQTGDGEEAPVEFGLVDLDTSAAFQQKDDRTGEQGRPQEAEAPPAFQLDQETQDSPEQTEASERPEFEFPGDAAAASAPDTHEPAPDSTATAGGNDESNLVASFDDDADVLELDELRRDDEAEPVEIHLLDPSYEGSAGDDDDDYAGGIDLSDLASTGPLDDADDYADDSFVADLSAAGEEKPPADELPGEVDVLNAALTLLPDDEAQDAAAPAAADEESPGAAADTWTDADAPAAADTWADADAPAAADVWTGPAPDSEPAAATSGWTKSEDEPLAAGEGGAPDTPREPEHAGPETAPAGELTEAGLGALSGAVEPAAEAAPVADVRRGEAGLMTETMAILYRSQGFHDRAADVYRALLRARPDDERLAAKLREAEQAAGSRGASAATPAATPAAEDEAGEVWLRGVGSAWTGTGGDAAEEATPYAWTGEADEADAGEPISAYLQDLVSWKARSGAWMEPDASAGEDVADEIEMPEWMDGPVTESWTPDPEPRPYPAAPAAEADWSPPAGSEPWNASAGAVEESGAPAAPDTESAGAWQEPEPSDPDPVPETDGASWTPAELDDDIAPAVPAAPSSAAAPAGFQPPSQPEEDASDDDDLEMFRSWLQSLKK